MLLHIHSLELPFKENVFCDQLRLQKKGNLCEKLAFEAEKLKRFLPTSRGNGNITIQGKVFCSITLTDCILLFIPLAVISIINVFGHFR